MKNIKNIFKEVVEMRKIPIGNSNFKEIIEKEGLFVDKSMFIYEILENMSKVQLFTRPRRFGKTTNLLMLREFFDIERLEENKNLFNNLEISKTPYIKTHRGKYPVIFISFKDIKDKTAEESFLSLKGIIGEIYNKHRYLMDTLNEEEVEKFKKILSIKEDGEYKQAIKKLCKYLYNYWGKKVIVLIDEYDTPLITAYIQDYYEEIISFYRIMYSLTFKDNEYLEKGIITGINRISKEGIFSGLNNLYVNTIFSKEYEKYFGFTEEEIKKLLEEYEINDKFEEVKKWYDGYNFNGMSIYNTWSIINYLHNKEFNVYWINTSDNGEITKFLGEVTKKTAGIKIFKELEKLAKGESITITLNENILFKDLTTMNELWNLMLNGGYLTILEEKRQRYKVKIPNYEIQKYFATAFIYNFINEENKIYNMMDSIIDGEIKLFENELKDYVLTSSSFMVSDKEVFYQGFMLGLFMLLRDYYIANIELETGKGRADMILESINKNNMSYIIEMKVVKSLKEVEEISQKALEQIKNKKYYNSLIAKKFKNITIMALIFYEKEVKFKFEVI